MPELKKIEQAGYCKIIVLADVEQTENDIRKMLERKEYKVLENSVYLGNTELLANYFGVRSWPHFFLINTDNVILYQDKIPSSDKLIRILKGA
jgi:TusA-related sulfurtransferase